MQSKIQTSIIPFVIALADRGRETGARSAPSRCHGLLACLSFSALRLPSNWEGSFCGPPCSEPVGPPRPFEDARLCCCQLSEVRELLTGRRALASCSTLPAAVKEWKTRLAGAEDVLMLRPWRQSDRWTARIAAHSIQIPHTMGECKPWDE